MFSKATRRRMARGIGTCLVLVVATVGFSAAPKVGALAPQVASAVPTYAAYHDATSATHQTNVNNLGAAGYRIISLSVYGSASDPRYAAVWVKRSGPAQLAFHGLTGTQVNSFDAAHHAAGYRPVLLSATGTSTSPVYAGVWERNGSTSSYSLALTKTQLDSNALMARQSTGSSAYYLTSVDAFGAGTSSRYAVVRQPNTKRYNHDTKVAVTGSQHQRWFDGLTPAGFRPGITTIGVDSFGSPSFTTLWNDSRIGAWYQKPYLTSAEYQTAFNEAAANGYFPIQVDGQVVGGTTRFSATFAQNDVPRSRVLTVTGAADSRLSGFDTWMTNYMRANALHAGSLAIARDGKLVYARGFTWAESGYPITQPTTTFRIASSSKALTGIAAMQLVDTGALTQGTKIQPILNIQRPNGSAPADSRWNDITLDNLLCQQSGIPGAYDLFDDVAIANAYGTSLPVTKRQNAGWASQYSLEHTPGTHYDYRNGNLNLAGMVLEAKTGLTYEQLVRNRIFTPLGITRPRVGRSLFANRLPGEVLYDTPVAVNGAGDNEVGVESVVRSDRPYVARSYGGWNQENHDASGGMVMAPVDWVKVMSSFHDGNSPLFRDRVIRGGTIPDPYASTMWSVCNSSVRSDAERGWYRNTHTKPDGTTVTFHEHNGSLPSNGYLVVHSAHLSFAIGFNRRVDPALFGTVQGEAIMDIADAITSWPTTDLFPSVGIPSN